jgi:hypothetical protein
MSELLYKENAFQLVDFCMQVHCELGKGQGMTVHRIAEHGWREMTKLPPSQLRRGRRMTNGFAALNRKLLNR